MSDHDYEVPDANPIVPARYCAKCRVSHLITEKCPKKPEKETAKPQKAGVGSDFTFFE